MTLTSPRIGMKGRNSGSRVSAVAERDLDPAHGEGGQVLDDLAPVLSHLRQLTTRRTSSGTKIGESKRRGSLSMRLAITPQKAMAS